MIQLNFMCLINLSIYKNLSIFELRQKTLTVHNEKRYFLKAQLTP